MIFWGNWRVFYQQVAILLAVGVGASSIVMSEFSTANLTLPSLFTLYEKGQFALTNKTACPPLLLRCSPARCTLPGPGPGCSLLLVQQTCPLILVSQSTHATLSQLHRTFLQPIQSYNHLSETDSDRFQKRKEVGCLAWRHLLAAATFCRHL